MLVTASQNNGARGQTTENARIARPAEWLGEASALAPLLKYSKCKDVVRGSKLHAHLLKRGFLQSRSHVADALVVMYAKSGLLAKALGLLVGLFVQNTFVWNTVIARYAQQGQGQDALDCFDKMQHAGLTPDEVTYVCILKACGSIGAGDIGSRIHDEIARRGLLEGNILLGTSLVDMYAKCGVLTKAQGVLEELPVRNVVTWNALIAGFTHHGRGDEALNCFQQMQHEGLRPNTVTFVCILKACGIVGALGEGEQVHEEIDKQGLLGRDAVLGAALVGMYAKCGALTKSKQVLEELPVRNVISWTALIQGYAARGQGEEALSCFHCMQSEGLSPDAVTFICLLKACGNIGAYERGEQIHNEIVARQLLRKDIALGNALLDMYAECGALAKAHGVLEELPTRNVVSWTALMEGYVQQEQGEKALQCFKQMQCEGLSPNLVTFVCVLKACGSSRALHKGEQVHDEIVKQKSLGKDSTLCVALVVMYAKCGAFEKARKVLKEFAAQDVLAWNALLEGYAQLGQSLDVLRCFDEIQNEGLSPNDFTFRCILNACCHSGLVEEGQMYFVSMISTHIILPDLGHYTCMVDCFGRAGHLDKAVAMIQKMPSYDYPVVWHALLGACWKCRDVNVGTWAFEHVLQLDRSDGAAYVLMANIHAAASREYWPSECISLPGCICKLA